MEMVSAAEKKLAGFKSLKVGIDADIARANETLDGVRKKIRENTLSNENVEGLLTGNQEEYLKCLQMNYRDLELLFKLDEAKWELNVQTKRSEANQFKEKLQAFLEE
jgi:hypothetical protein